MKARPKVWKRLSSLCTLGMVLAPLTVGGQQGANIQQLLAAGDKELTVAYQGCLGRFPANLKEQLRIAQRAWITFSDKDEAAFAIVGKRKGLTAEDLDRASLPEVSARSEMLRNYFGLPNEDLSSLRQDSERAEQDLTAAYKQAISSLSADEEKKLREAERAWIEYRDKDVHAHLGDPSGRAPVWASVVIARRRTAELREFYLQRLPALPTVATAPAPAATPAPTPTPPRMDPAVRAKLAAEFRDATRTLLTRISSSGVLVAAASLDDVKGLPATLADEIDAFKERTADFRARLETSGQRYDDCRADLDTADAFVTLQKSTRDIRAANTPAASGELSLFHGSSPNPPGDAQKPLWDCLTSLWTLCNRLEADSKTHRQRARDFAAAGKTGDAIKEYQEAYRIYPDPEVAESIKRLREDSLGL